MFVLSSLPSIFWSISLDKLNSSFSEVTSFSSNMLEGSSLGEVFSLCLDKFSSILFCIELNPESFSESG